MRKLILMFLLALSMTGCGGDGDTSQANNQPNVKSIDAGGYRSTIKNSPRSYSIYTQKGGFVCYTTLGVPYDAPVTMEVYTDSKTGLVLGKALKSYGNTALIRAIISTLDMVF